MSAGDVEAVIKELDNLGCQPEQAGDQYSSYCPVHELDGKGHKKSLSVKSGNKVAVVVTCHAGCSFNELRKVITSLNSTKERKEVEATYLYRNREGKEEFRKLRFWPKDFRIENHNIPSNDPNKMRWKLPLDRDITEWPLYRLPELVAAKDTGETVFYCEGEKDTDRLVKHNCIATTNYEGASKGSQKPKWRLDYERQLTGLNSLVLLPDNDEPGRSHMANIAKQMMGKVGEIITLDLGLRFPDLKAGGDVSDWLNAGHSVEELLELVSRCEPLTPATADNAATTPVEPPTSDDQNLGKETDVPAQPSPPSPAESVMLRSAATIIPRAIDWLWPGWLSVGKLHLLAGAPGTAKTTIAMTWAAAISTGGTFPDGSRAPQGNVLIWSSEDDPRDTLIPRLIAAGADLNHVHIVESVNHSKTGKRTFDPAKDFPLLKAAVNEIGNVVFMVIDSVADAVAGDAGKNNQVRRALSPVKDFAEEMGIAVLGITHFNKGTSGRAISRIIDSVAFVGLPRIVMVAFKKKGNGSLIMRAKSNIGPDNGGYEFYTFVEPLIGYDGISANRVGWKGFIDGSADEHLQEAESAFVEPESERERAEQFLLDELDDGMRKESSVISDKAKSVGISSNALFRAREALGIKSKRIGKVWYLYPAVTSGSGDSDYGENPF